MSMMLPDPSQSGVTPALNVVPMTVAGSTILGYSWSEVVNVLACISLFLQIAWFVYDKARTIKRRQDGKDHGN